MIWLMKRNHSEKEHLPNHFNHIYKKISEYCQIIITWLSNVHISIVRSSSFCVLNYFLRCSRTPISIFLWLSFCFLLYIILPAPNCLVTKLHCKSWCQWVMADHMSQVSQDIFITPKKGKEMRSELIAPFWIIRLT